MWVRITQAQTQDLETPPPDHGLPALSGGVTISLTAPMCHLRIIWAYGRYSKPALLSFSTARESISGERETSALSALLMVGMRTDS